MKKILLLTCCLLMAVLLIPGTIASWEGVLKIDGKVTVIEPVQNTYDLTISVRGAGTTNLPTGVHHINKDETVYLAAYPAEGWIFESWNILGQRYEMASEILFDMIGDISITAVFIEKDSSVDLDEENIEQEEEPCEDRLAEEPEPMEPEVLDESETDGVEQEINSDNAAPQVNEETVPESSNVDSENNAGTLND